MKVFAGRDIVSFLRAVDRHLKDPFRMEVIGGAAALLSFKIESGTLDIDSTNDVRAIEGACEAARKETGLEIPLQVVGIYDAPYHYESRLRRILRTKLKKLQVVVPEKHDWALMKIVRLIQKDIEDIREVEESVGFSKNVLLRRFLDEMTHVTGRREDLVFQFLAMMEQLYGEEDADRMEKAIKTHKNWT